jgi:predicted transcriptional regulator
VRRKLHSILDLFRAKVVQQYMLQKQMGLSGERSVGAMLRNEERTLVVWRNITNGRFILVAISCSAPIMIPLSIKTALGKRVRGPIRRF